LNWRKLGRFAPSFQNDWVCARPLNNGTLDRGISLNKNRFLESGVRCEQKRL
jgi:hypothetical protein